MREVHNLEKSAYLRQKALELQKYIRKQQKATLRKHRAALKVRDKEINVLKEQVAKQGDEMETLKSENQQLRQQLTTTSTNICTDETIRALKSELKSFEKNIEQQRQKLSRVEQQRDKLIDLCLNLFEQCPETSGETEGTVNGAPSFDSERRPSQNELLEEFQFHVVSTEFFRLHCSLSNKVLESAKSQYPSSLGFLSHIPPDQFTIQTIQDYFTLPNGAKDCKTLVLLLRELRKQYLVTIKPEALTLDGSSFSSLNQLFVSNTLLDGKIKRLKSMLASSV